MNERVNECISRSIFNATRTGHGNGFNEIMSNGDIFKKVIMYILPSRQERKILVEATRTCVWLKLCLQHVCEIDLQHKSATQLPWFHISSDQLNTLPKRTALSSFSYIEGMADL